MPTATTRPIVPVPIPTLHLALDLGNTAWKLAFATGVAQPPRLRTAPARDLPALDAEIAAAKARFGLPAHAPVVACYEAGRDGFWIQRALTARGVLCLVVDSASIRESRRKRRPKSDRLDATALVGLLIRHGGGERDVWSVVHVPSVGAEDRRHLHRELFVLTHHRTRQVNRIRGLLALHGVVLPRLRGLPATPPALRDWAGQPLPPGLSARLHREWARLRATHRDLLALRAERRRLLASPEAAGDPTLGMVTRLLALRGIGEVSAWLYTTEFFAWRQLRNRRQVGGLAGLTATPRESGDARQELGISKAGNALIRALAIELAWSWVRRQPASALTRWYRRRFSGSPGCGASASSPSPASSGSRSGATSRRACSRRAPCSRPNRVGPRVRLAGASCPLLQRVHLGAGGRAWTARSEGAARREGCARTHRCLWCSGPGRARHGWKPTPRALGSVIRCSRQRPSRA